MANISSGSTTAAATGGIDPLTGMSLDTVIQLGGASSKSIATIYASYGANGGVWDTGTVYCRLAVIAGALNPGVNQYNVGINAPSPVIEDAGGILLLDVDLIFASPASGIPIPSVYEFNFDALANEGKVGTDSGPLSIILTAGRGPNGSVVTGATGKLNVQYITKYNLGSVRDYAIAR